MAVEYLANEVQEVALNTPISLNASIPCTKGYVVHEDDTGIFILRGIVNNCCNEYAHYSVTFNVNIAIPEGGDITPIAIAIVVNGVTRLASRAIFTPSAVDEYGNVTSTAIIRVPKGCCFTVAVESVSATMDPAVVPTPIIEVQNANLVINRIA